jgi:zinc/manganese transport system substrate-binding protein
MGYEMRYLRVMLVLVVMLLATRELPATAQESRLPVVATFSILGDIVQNVGGERIQLRTLLGANGDMHVYEPTPADARAIANASLVFEIGLGFETRLDGLIRGSGSRVRRVAVTDGMSLIPTAAGDPHRHGAYDPHVWHDVTNAIHMTNAVRDALVQVDPAGREFYYLNAAVYVWYLEQLDAWIHEQVATLPPERRKLVTEHTNMAYFARRYGFELFGTVIGSVSTEAEATPRQLADLIRRVKASGIPAVFAENISSPRRMERLAEDAGVSVAIIYTDALGRPGSDGDTYHNLMRANTRTIVQALGR